jgi:tetratricopeptide (TPR) repeat protein
LRVLLGLLLVLVCFVVGRWLYQRWGGSLPEPPVLALEGIDPEVATALAEGRAAVQKSPRSPEAWSILAMLLDAHHYFDEAIVCYSATETLDPTNPYWPHLQGALLAKGPNPEKALGCFERAARLAPSESMPTLQLADLLLALGRVEDADKAFQGVLAKDANSMYAAYARLGLAQVAITRQKYQEALACLEALVQDPHARKRACALRAAAYERLSNSAGADVERRRLAELPDDVPWPDASHMVNKMRVGLRARLDRADLLVRQKQPAEAVKLMQETVHHHPRSDQAWLSLGVARQNIKDFQGAERALAKAMELAPKRADHYYYFGELLRVQQRYEEAAAKFRKASELRPADGGTYLMLGDCLQAQGEKTGAAEAFQKALRYNPELTEARQRLEMLDKK